MADLNDVNLPGDTVLIDTDTYIDDNTRYHRDGSQLILQIKVGGVWTDQVTLG